MTLNDQQQKAVDSGERLILLNATAGSGKTATLIARIKRIAESNNPRRIAAITFTNNAAREMRERLAPLEIGFVGTIHSFIIRLLRKYGARYDLPSTFTVLDKEEAEALKRSIFGDDLADADKALEKVGPSIVLHKGVVEGALSKEERLAARYYTHLVHCRMMDFDTILKVGDQLVEYLYQDGIKEFSHLFWDEFQDSNETDFNILRIIPVDNKFVAADADQGIYGFRGGKVGNFLLLSRAACWITITLPINYRSGKAIVDASRRLIENNADRPYKPICASSGFPGVIAAFGPYESAQTELHAIAAHLLYHCEDESGAVLCRTNRIAEFVAGHLKAQGFMISEPELTKLPEDWRTARKALNFAIDPNNDQLAYWWFSEGVYRGAVNTILADEWKAKAIEEFSSINDASSFPNSPETVASEFAANYGRNFSRETNALIRSLLDSLGKDATPEELAIAMAELDGRGKARTPGITVSTIHAAKGLEWDHVILLAFEEGLIPSTTAIDDGLVEEERRLAFVAVTRARRSVTILFARERQLNQWVRREQSPSRFISELGIIPIAV